MFVQNQAMRFIISTGLALLALVSLIRALHFTFLTEEGGLDFHSYWYAGLFVRQHQDPYTAYVTRQKPETPITFLGGAVDENLNRGLVTTPANTAPIILLLTPLAWLPWTAAKTIWFIINCIFALLLPWLTIRLLPANYQPHGWSIWLLYLTFFALKGTRGTLGTGQTTLFVLVCMLACVLLWDKNWLWAGALLGIALSKYSVALPLMLYALYKRKFKVILVSFVIQGLGTLIIAAISGNTPWTIVGSYIVIFQRHVNLPGLHLSNLFALGSLWRILAPTLLTLTTGGILLWKWYQNTPKPSDQTPKFLLQDLHLLAIFCLWTLLVAYHRPYDGILILLFLVILACVIAQPMIWSLSLVQYRIVMLLGLLGTAMLIAPYEQISALMPVDNVETLLNLLDKGVTVALVIMLALLLWLWARLWPEIQT